MAKIPKVALLLEASGEWSRALLKGIVKYARLHGPWSFHFESNLADFDVSSVKKWGFDGIIMRDRPEFSELRKLDVPVFICPEYKAPSGKYPVIVSDDIGIGRMAAEHFLEKGFRNFAFCGWDGFSWSNGRNKGFAARVKEEGFEVFVHNQSSRGKGEKRKSKESELLFLANKLNSLEKPLGVMACNDYYCLNIIETCKSVGMKISGNVAFIGVDNDELACELSNPPLTSIVLDIEGAGYEAAGLLDRMMKGESIEDNKVVIRPMYVAKRQSTDVLAIKDDQIALALRFISENSKRPIQARDVVDSTMISRRELYYRFQKYLGSSIYKEIRKGRVEEISRLLRETNMSISQISYTLGFTDASHLSRYFKQEKKISPLEYRAKYF